MTTLRSRPRAITVQATGSGLYGFDNGDVAFKDPFEVICKRNARRNYQKNANEEQKKARRQKALLKSTTA